MPSPDQPITDALPCPLWRRLLALVYDVLIVVALVMVVGLLCQLVTGGRLIQVGAHTVIPAWYRPLQGLVVAAYFISSWLRGGQTVGMRPWHIRLCRPDGSTPTLQQAVLRLLVASAPMLLLLLAPSIGLHATLWTLLAAWAVWFATALFDQRRRALHDIVAATELRQLG
jgi:uncharacterized RDD family membrane protein YckC